MGKRWKKDGKKDEKKMKKHGKKMANIKTAPKRIKTKYGQIL